MSAVMPTAALDKSRGTMVVSIPVAFVQRGGRKQIVVPIGAEDWLTRSAAPRSAIVTAVAKAYHWRTLLEDGEFSSAAELAKASQVNESYLCRVLRLTLLAPDIVEATLDGRQPSTLELKDLLKPFPLEWQAQRKLWGLSLGAAPADRLSLAGRFFRASR